jgi:hypothetical protein
MTAHRNWIRSAALTGAAALALCGLVAPAAATAVPVAAPAGTPCAAGAPVTGDYNGDGSPDLAISLWDNWVDGTPLFVSLTGDNRGSWLAVDGATSSSSPAPTSTGTCAPTRW